MDECVQMRVWTSVFRWGCAGGSVGSWAGVCWRYWYAGVVVKDGLIEVGLGEDGVGEDGLVEGGMLGCGSWECV